MKLSDIKDKDIYIETYEGRFSIMTGKDVKNYFDSDPSYFSRTDSRLFRVESELSYSWVTKLKQIKPQV